MGFRPGSQSQNQGGQDTSVLVGSSSEPQHYEIKKDNGATRRDRTGDLLITNQPLYQLS